MDKDIKKVKFKMTFHLEAGLVWQRQKNWIIDGTVATKKHRLNCVTENDDQTEENLPVKLSKDRQTEAWSQKYKKKHHYTFSALMFILLIIAPAKCDYKLAPFNSSESIYLDKMSDILLQRDEWRWIVYYDLQPYWEGSKLLKQYVAHLDSMCSKNTNISLCDIVLMQLRQGCTELDHNSMVLEQQFTGDLDGEFYLQYQKDIELIRSNEKHRLLLWQNQTSVVEAESNVMKRIEETMNKYYKTFNFSVEKGGNGLNEQFQTSLAWNNFSTSSLVANNILLNLKTVQETLMSVITSAHYGRYNIHLLTPKQFTHELSVISGEVSGKDLTLPIRIIQSELSKIYPLLKTRARVTKKYIIFEVKIPLVSRYGYDLYKIVTIPKQIGDNMVSIIPIGDRIAMSIQDDRYIPMSESDVQNCLEFDTNTRICSLKRPIFRLRFHEKLCMKVQNSDQCKTESTVCKNSWTELNQLNTYLYFCCGQCTVLVICEYKVTRVLLTKAGIITFSKECVISGHTYIIHSHNTLSTSLNTGPNIQIEIPYINKIFNLSMPTSSMGEQIEHDHPESKGDIDHTVDQMKENAVETNVLSCHDIHHYTMIYIVVCVAVVAVALFLWRRVRRTRSASLTESQQHQPQSAISVQCVNECELPGAISARTQNMATSPVFFKAVFRSND